MRTLKRSDTWNATTNSYHYPQTPARVELSLWPAGSSKNGQGTISWAGGLVDWSAPDVQKFGYYYAMFKDVNVQCYDPPTGANKTGSKSYVYNAKSGTNSSVAITDDNTVLKSLLGSGTDMDADYPHASASGSAASPSATANTVPGLTGAGPGTNGHAGNDGNDGTTEESGSTVASASGASSTGAGGFSQGSSAQSKSDASSPKERGLQSSMFAALMAILGLLVL